MGVMHAEVAQILRIKKADREPCRHCGAGEGEAERLIDATLPPGLARGLESRFAAHVFCSRFAIDRKHAEVLHPEVTDLPDHLDPD
jgi:hypothetical protein